MPWRMKVLIKSWDRTKTRHEYINTCTYLAERWKGNWREITCVIIVIRKYRLDKSDRKRLQTFCPYKHIKWKWHYKEFLKYLLILQRLKYQSTWNVFSIYTYKPKDLKYWGYDFAEIIDRDVLYFCFRLFLYSFVTTYRFGIQGHFCKSKSLFPHKCVIWITKLSFINTTWRYG